MLTDGNTLLKHLEKQNTGGSYSHYFSVYLFYLPIALSNSFFWYLFIYLILCERKPENKKEKVHFLLGIQLSPLDLVSSSIHGASPLPLLWLLWC